MTKKTTTAFVLAAMVAGCGDSPTNNGATAEGGEETTSPSTASETSSAGTQAEGSSGAVTNASTMGSEEASTAPAESTGDDGSGIKLDQGAIPDTPMNSDDCEDGPGGKGGGGNADPDFSFIWVANSSEGTVSKIDTVTLLEVGRYRTRMDAAGSPSRTSVNLNGDVAVANRSGGVVKILADTESCDNGNTSTGAGDVKAWPDDCVHWFTPLAYTSNRPVAWTSGEWSGITCRYENTKVWTAGANATIDVLLLDGETGVVEQTIPIPEAQADYFGIYGGASDADSNFWGSQLGIGHLVYVDFDDFEHAVYPMPIGGYGMTVDQDGFAYTCSSGVAKFDPDSLTWQTNPNVGGGGGCMTDGLGNLWVGGYGGGLGGQMISVDTETMTVNQTVDIPNYVHGISVDFYGYVWGVTHSQPDAYKVDPVAGTFETFTGLNGPYTYSDMTGYALSNASGLPPSG